MPTNILAGRFQRKSDLAEELLHQDVFHVMWWPYQDGFPGWNWLWGSLMMLLMIGFWGFFLWLLYSLVSNPNQKNREGSLNAEDIARKRFASGEIGQEEFDRIMTGLMT